MAKKNLYRPIALQFRDFGRSHIMRYYASVDDWSQSVTSGRSVAPEILPPSPLTEAPTFAPQPSSNAPLPNVQPIQRAPQPRSQPPSNRPRPQPATKSDSIDPRLLNILAAHEAAELEEPDVDVPLFQADEKPNPQVTEQSTPDEPQISRMPTRRRRGAIIDVPRDSSSETDTNNDVAADGGQTLPTNDATDDSNQVQRSALDDTDSSSTQKKTNNVGLTSRTKTITKPTHSPDIAKQSDRSISRRTADVQSVSASEAPSNMIAPQTTTDEGEPLLSPDISDAVLPQDVINRQIDTPPAPKQANNESIPTQNIDNSSLQDVISRQADTVSYSSTDNILTDNQSSDTSSPQEVINRQIDTALLTPSLRPLMSEASDNIGDTPVDQSTEPSSSVSPTETVARAAQDISQSAASNRQSNIQRASTSPEVAQSSPNEGGENVPEMLAETTFTSSADDSGDNSPSLPLTQNNIQRAASPDVGKDSTPANDIISPSQASSSQAESISESQSDYPLIPSRIKPQQTPLALSSSNIRKSVQRRLMQQAETLSAPTKPQPSSAFVPNNEIAEANTPIADIDTDSVFVRDVNRSPIQRQTQTNAPPSQIVTPHFVSPDVSQPTINDSVNTSEPANSGDFDITAGWDMSTGVAGTTSVQRSPAQNTSSYQSPNIPTLQPINRVISRQPELSTRASDSSESTPQVHDIDLYEALFGGSQSMPTQQATPTQQTASLQRQPNATQQPNATRQTKPNTPIQNTSESTGLLGLLGLDSDTEVEGSEIFAQSAQPLQRVPLDEALLGGFETPSGSNTETPLSATLVQREPDTEIQPPVSTEEGGEGADGEDDSEEESDDALVERLARQVYDMIKGKLRIERERGSRH